MASFKLNPALSLDFYKTGHYKQYPADTELIVTNLTPRKSRIDGITHVVNFGMQKVVVDLHYDWHSEFFSKPKDEVCESYMRIMNRCLGENAVTIDHIAELHDLGYLPIAIYSLPEGVKCPIRVPIMIMFNTNKRFAWIVNYLETQLSADSWGMITSATISNKYYDILSKAALKSVGSTDFVKFQGHDFSMRGMYGVDAAIKSGMGHLINFVGTDTVPAILALEHYYGANVDTELVGCSVAATEHSVMCSGVGLYESRLRARLADDLIAEYYSGQSIPSEIEYRKIAEYATIKHLITEVYPSGMVSIVSDTFDLWAVCTEYLPRLKDIILKRDGKVIVRPDSGNPVDIICGVGNVMYTVDENGNRFDLKNRSYSINVEKGVIELLWDVFGGTISEQGYKVLDPHIGAIYGDSITLQYAQNICDRLMAKGFASTNIVLGIGSYTFQYVTRDTFGFALKSTYIEVDGEGIPIYKDPVTDDGTKKSLKGLIRVVWDDAIKDYIAIDMVGQKEFDAHDDALQCVYKDGRVFNVTSLTDIRSRVECNNF